MIQKLLEPNKIKDDHNETSKLKNNILKICIQKFQTIATQKNCPEMKPLPLKLMNLTQLHQFCHIRSYSATEGDNNSKVLATRKKVFPRRNNTLDTFVDKTVKSKLHPTNSDFFFSRVKKWKSLFQHFLS